MASTIERSDTVRLGDADVPYLFKRVPRRRHVHIFIGDDGTIEVRAPWRFGVHRAREVLLRNADWILNAMASARARLAQRPRLVTGTRLPLLDGAVRLEVRPRAQADLFECAGSAKARVERRGPVLRVGTTSLGESELRALIEHWYRGEASAHLPARIEHYAPRLGVRPSRVTIRGQRSRWGSCSTRGTVSLNWRLMMAPSSLADYVVVHELCHLRHMNHSPRFWAMVGTVVPDYRERRRRLNALHEHLPV